VAEVLKLMKLDHYNLPLSFAPRAWLESAVVASRAAAALAAKSGAGAGGAANGAAAAVGGLPLLLSQLRDTTAAALLEGSATAVSDDHFALLTAGVMQAVGVHTRLAVCCEPPLVSEGEEVPRCGAVSEVRMGKSAQKLNRWVAQHRKAQRALRKSVKGAIEIHFRRDHQGYLWLPLRWRSAAAEQLPGAPYANASFCMHHYEKGRYVVEGEPLDSRGMATGRERPDKVLCTL